MYSLWCTLLISNPPFRVLYSSLCSLQERSLSTLRFNHSNASGIDITYNLLYIRLWNSLQTVVHRAHNNEVTFYELLEYFEQLLK